MQTPHNLSKVAHRLLLGQWSVLQKLFQSALGAILHEEVDVVGCFDQALHLYDVLVLTFPQAIYLLLELGLLG